MRLYHDRQPNRGGALDTRDEEECFTAAGRRIGVWMSTTAVAGPNALVAEVDVSAVQDYEVSGTDSGERSFVVPALVAAELGFHTAGADEAR